jgi:hypothetical protein
LQRFARSAAKEMGLDPELVLRAHLGPLVDQLELEELDAVKPDRNACAAWGEVFTGVWRKRVEEQQRRSPRGA